MNSPSHPRLVDVAERAGVSMRTVSNVVNGYVHVSQRTRERVQQAIEELGYRPNLVARNLARGRTGLVAVALPQLEMPYFASLTRHLLDAAEQMGLHLVVAQTHQSRELELAAMEGRFEQRIDGVILSPTSLRDDDLAARTSAVPLVLLGDRAWPDHLASVAIDRLAAARAAVTHLVERGHRRIAIVGKSLSGSNARWQGWCDALADAGVSVAAELQIETSDISGADGEQAASRILALSEPADAVFCVTDWVALGVIRGLQRAGVAVPEDVAVVGHDDIPYGTASNPTLSTVSPDRAEIARLALTSISEQSAGGAPGGLRQAAWRLVVRESSGTGR